MKIAVAQLNYTVGDFETNKVKIIGAINKAKDQGADLVVFAEHAISGTPAYDLLNKIDFLELCEESLVEIASFCEGISAIVGLPVQSGNRIFSAAALIQNRKIIHYITKRNIYLRDEQRFISSGKGSEYFLINGKKVAVVLGDGLLNEEEYSGKVHSVVNISADPYSRAIIEKRCERMKRQSFTLDANYVFVNQVGGQTDVIFDGSSAVFNPKGEAVAFLKNFEEDFLIIDVDEDHPAIELPYQNKTENVYKAIKLGLRDFFLKQGYKTACLGLSGGIDSAVVAAIAVEVLGAENIRVLLMPSQYSSDHSVEDAVDMAERIGLQYNVVPINESYDAALKALEPVFGMDMEFGTAEENIQARLRMVMLMALSNKFGNILLNTSNKSELAVGYGTLYGDNTGVISIMGDLYKSEVFDLARYINRDAEVIPQSIIMKEPSAELRPGQKDTDTLPAYDVVDAILYRMIEERQSREEIINAGFDAEVVYKIYGMILKNEQKRFQFCPVLRVSTCPFGVERIMPLTSKYGF